MEELQTNPLLEEYGSNDESLDGEVSELSPDEITEDTNEDFPEDQIEASNESDEASSDLESVETEDLTDMDFSDEFSILKEMQEDMREHFENEYAGEAILGNSEAEEKRKFFFDSLVAETSLQEHLLEQLKLIETTTGQREACEYLIGSLDENGFMPNDLSDLALLSGIALEDLQNGLKILQTFDPTGIASADLRDCLLKQIEYREWEGSGAYDRKSFPLLLVRRRVPELSRKLSQSTEEIHAALEKIAELDPSPGRRFSKTAISRFLRCHCRKSWRGMDYRLNNDYIPRLKINKTYKELISKGTLSSKEKEYVRNQMRAGKFLINSIDQRQNTIESESPNKLKNRRVF